ERLRPRRPVHEGRAVDEEGRLRAAPDGEVRLLEEAEAGVEERRLRGAEVGRRVAPREAGLVELLAALPALALDDLEVRLHALDLDDPLRVLADREAVARRDRGPARELPAER